MTWLCGSGPGSVLEVAVNVLAGTAVSDDLTGARGSTHRVGSKLQFLTRWASPEGH